MPKHILTFCILVLAQISFVGSARAQSPVMFPASPQANGRGGVYTSPDDADPLAPLSNPGLLGLMARHNRFMAAGYPQRTAWVIPPLEGFPEGRFGLSSRALYFGFDQRTLEKYFKARLPFSIGLGYHETNLAMPDFLAYNSLPRNPGSSWYDNSKGFSIGMGGEVLGIDAGVGFNLKYVIVKQGRFEDHLTTSDFGLYAEAPWKISVYRQPLSAADSRLRWVPFLTPGLGYSMLNVGPRYTEAYSPFPIKARPERTAKLSYTLSTGLDAHHLRFGDWRILSLEGGVEGEDLLVTDNGYGEYQGIYGDISPMNNVLLAEDNRQITRREGWEIGLGEIIYVRGGDFILAGTERYEYMTTGYGLRLGGLLKLALLDRDVRSSHAVSFVAKHLDLQYDQSTVRFHRAQLPPGITVTSPNLTYHELEVVWHQ